jgi:nitrite reductase (NADH) small subunit/3-phenylpropionate/trans-cinnamate dioxygenase ferredoxin subunit
VTVGDYEVALFNVGGRIFATESTCPHQGAPLVEGWVEDGCLTCPWHAWTFRLETGKMMLGDHGGLAVFEVKIEGTMILVGAQPRE